MIVESRRQWGGSGVPPSDTVNGFRPAVSDPRASELTMHAAQPPGVHLSVATSSSRRSTFAVHTMQLGGLPAARRNDPACCGVHD
jgi:hypothetical protein